MNSKKLRDDKFIKIFFETSPDMVAILDKDGKILDCNSHFAENARYEKNELYGMVAPVDFISEKDRPKSISAFNEVVEKGIKRDVELEVVRKDGSTYPSIWSGQLTTMN